MSSTNSGDSSTESNRFQKLHYLLQQSEVYSQIIGQRLQKEKDEFEANAEKAKAKEQAKDKNEQNEQNEQKAESVVKEIPQQDKKPAQQTRRRSGRHSQTSESLPKNQQQSSKQLKQSRAQKRKSGLITDFFTEEDLEKETKRARQNQANDKKTKTVSAEPHLSPDSRQPSLVTGAELRDYQLVGMEWLVTLYENGLNGILADEMGLGKTLQTIAFLAYLRERGVWGPFLVVCPLSTLASWVNEFERFTPDIPALLYHGPPPERQILREENLKLNKEFDPARNFPILVTTYELVMNDRKHLSKIPWKYIIVDESHRLKNMNCKLLQELKTYDSANRLLLTGTPLQNNLTELWSLLNYILPDIFPSLDDFQEWFDFSDLNTAQGNDRILSSEQSNKIVTKLHAILKPFLLRRLKKDVEKHLPPKKEYLLYAPLTAPQKELYEAVVNKQLRQFLLDRSSSGSTSPATPSSASSTNGFSRDGSPAPSSTIESNSSSSGEKSRDSTPITSRTRTKRKPRQSYVEESDRTFFKNIENGDLPQQSPSSLSDVTEIGEDYHKKRERRKINEMHLQNLVMQLRKVCNHPWLFDWPTDERTGQYIVNEDLINASGKMLLLNRLLSGLFENQHKVLLFSQFTSMLDILEEWATQYKGWKICRIDGSTSQEERRDQMKRFNTETGPNSCKLFLLSTRSGGVGINLVAADTVILFDSDWNPQMDLQAMDRVHRIGQTKPVLVFRLISANTAESKILQKASAKRKLEALVIGEGKFTVPGQTANEVLGKRTTGTGTNSTMTEMAKILMRNEDEPITVVDKNDVILSNEQLDILLDRSDEAMNRSGEWTSGNGDKASVAVFASEQHLKGDEQDE